MTEAPTHLRLITAKEASARLGHKVPKLYVDVRDGLLPQPIRRGKKFSRWPEHEIEAVLRAHIAGADAASVRALVAALHVQRGLSGGGYPPSAQSADVERPVGAGKPRRGDMWSNPAMPGLGAESESP